ERQKRRDYLTVEIKTEEHALRQELISDIMLKRAELEKSLNEEKQAYLRRFRNELLKSAPLNRELLEAEIQKLEKNWPLN
ncbi:MAG: hypothetical protein OEV92_09870, partial [Nitrospinota bacterium]|nr:hypothetical protein [Nitrospinota bacterium]